MSKIQFWVAIFLLLGGFGARAGEAPSASFADAYKEILARSLRIESQRTEIESAEARRLSARGAFLPQVELGVSHDEDTSLATPARNSAWLSGKVNLFRFGGDAAGVRGADKNLEGQKARLLSERQGAEDDAVQALATFIARRLNRGIQERNVEMNNDSLRISHERFRRGLMPMQEVDKVAIDVDNARASLTDAIQQESTARAKLVTALGSDAVAGEWPWKKAIVDWSPPIVDKVRFESRPDWRALESFLSEERFKQKRALSGLLPTLDLSLSYGSYDLSQTGRADWASKLTLSIPLFNRFEDWSGYRQQMAAAQLANLRLEALRREAPAETAALLRSFREARDAALAREKTAKLTEKLYKDNLQRFRLGRASANDLAVDLNRLLLSQVNEVDGWLSAHLMFVKLCHSLGSFVTADGHCTAEASNL